MIQLNSISKDDQNREQSYISFINDDARNFHLPHKVAAAICVYDVIGSFPQEDDNLKILKSIERNMIRKGKLILSVMNMDLTYIKCNKRGNVIAKIKEHILKLIRLRSSNIMQNNGEIFDGAKIIIDDSTGCCYRKEQFLSNSALPIEYVIIDRRYSIEGIKKLVLKAGFIVDECYCVRAGYFNEKLDRHDEHAKEILVVAHKAGILRKHLQSKIDIGCCWK
jgi:hypothetical protein